MKIIRTLVAFALTASALIFTQCDRPVTSGNTFPARWIFNERNTPLYAEKWVNEPHVIRAMNGSPAFITAKRADGSTKQLTFTDRNGNPFVSTLTKDDCLLFCMPSDGLGKGSSIEVEAAIISNPASPKYFIIEYLEGGKWKYVEENVMPVPEDPTLCYSFRCSGIGEGEPHEYTSVYQTITLSKPVRKDGLKIRFRAVGDFTCSGVPQSREAADGAIGLVHHGFNGAYLQDYGTSVPCDTTRILCIGNSFTYFSNVPSMLKEIAWSQGHYFDVFAHLKVDGDASGFGHGGSDFFSMYYFIKKILGDEDADTIDVYEALDMFLPGLFAYRSILAGGIPMAVPNLRNKEEREIWRNDTACTDPKAAGDMLLPNFSAGTPEIPQEVYDYQAALWAEECTKTEGTYRTGALSQGSK